MNVVGIDVSKGKSTIAVASSSGLLIEPFEIKHTHEDFDYLARLIKDIPGETKTLMECTGHYHILLAEYLQNHKFFVSVINPLLIKRFDTNLRKVKTDKMDAIKIANYGVLHWKELKEMQSLDKTREILKELVSTHHDLTKLKISLTNQLICKIDIVFPGINNLFPPDPRTPKVKWVDFIMYFHSAAEVAAQCKSLFLKKYDRFCTKYGYRYSENKALEIYSLAKSVSSENVKNEAACTVVETYAKQLQEVCQSVTQISLKLNEYSERLPEYDIVMQMPCVGTHLGPQLMAEIGDVRRFKSKTALVAYAGIDPPPFQSGKFDAKSRNISKRGPTLLRRTLFLIMAVYYLKGNQESDIYQFMLRKRNEGKHYYAVLIAGANKFLRQYYVKVKEAIELAS